MTALPKPPAMQPSSTVSTLPVFRAQAQISRSSKGFRKRGLMTAAWMPALASLSAAASAGCTRLPAGSSSSAPFQRPNSAAHPDFAYTRQAPTAPPPAWALPRVPSPAIPVFEFVLGIIDLFCATQIGRASCRERV